MNKKNYPALTILSVLKKHFFQAVFLNLGCSIFVAAYAFDSPNSITLTWEPVEYASGYQLEEKRVGDSWETATIIHTNDAQSTLTGRDSGDYIYRVIGCIEHPNDGMICNEDVATYSSETLAMLGFEGAEWDKDRIHIHETSTFRWNISGGSECINETGQSVLSSGSISVTPSSVSVIEKSVSCNGERFSDSLAILPDSHAILPNPISNPIDEAGMTVVGSIPDSLSVGPMGNIEYFLPIATAPGSGGLTPDISLKYDSGASNGLLGVGWSISGISQLSKCAKTKVDDNDVSTIENKDRLCLDGKKLLLLSGTYNEPGASYQLHDKMPMSIVAGNTTVEDGVESYTVTLTDGQILIYSLVSSETWALTKKQDIAGNYILFNYAPPEHYGLFPSESPVALLTSIQYTGNVFANKAPNNAIFFNYENREDSIIKRGYRRDIRKRLDTIVSKVNVSNVSSAAGDELRTYDLTYKAADVSNRSLISEISSCSGTTCLPTTKFEWQEGNTDFTRTQDIKFHSDSDSRGQKALDANGDGITDFILIDDDKGSTDHVRIVQGGRIPKLVQSVRNAANNDFRRTWQIIDMNHDGRDDILAKTGGAWRVFLSVLVNGSPNDIMYDFQNPLSVNIDHLVNEVKIGDFNADTFPDILFYKDQSLYIQYQDPNKSVFLEPQVAPIVSTFPYHNEFLRKEYFSEHNPMINNIRLTDTDGDGVSELIMHIPNDVYKHCQRRDTFNPAPPNYTGKKDYYGQWSVLRLDLLGRFQITGEIGDWNSFIYNQCVDFPVFESGVLLSFDYVDFEGTGYKTLVTETLTKTDDSPDVISTLKAYDLSLETYRGRISGLAGRSFRYLFGDYDSDSDVDLLFYKNNGHNNNDGKVVYKMLPRKGGSFFKPTTQSLPFAPRELNDEVFTNIQYVYKHGGINAFIELNGDGVQDYASVKGHINYQLSESSYRDLLVEITNGFGKKSTIRYESLTKEGLDFYYTRETNANDLVDLRCKPNGDFCSKILDVALPIHAVAKVEVEGESDTRYSYRGLKAQYGFGLLGFSQVSSYEHFSGVNVTTQYHQAFPFTGRPYKAEIEQGYTALEEDECSSGACPVAAGEKTTLSITEYSYAEYSSGTDSPICVTSGAMTCTASNFLNQSYIYPYSVVQTEFNVDLERVLSVSTTTNENLDSFGNVGTKTEEITANGSVVSTTVTDKEYIYFNDLYAWRLANQVVTYSRPNEDTVSQAESYTYSSANNYLLESKEVNGGSYSGFTTNDALSANFYQKETYTRDYFGNIIFVEKTAAGALPQASRYVYDEYGRYIKEEHQYIGNSLSESQYTSGVPSLKTTTVYDPILGLPRTITSANGQTTSYGYNSLGRLNFTFNANGSYSTVTQELCSFSGDCPIDGNYVETTTVSNGPDSKVYFDNKGLILREKSQTLSDVPTNTISWVQKNYAYDKQNRKIVESVPHFPHELNELSGSNYSESNLPPRGYSFMVYDNFNRVTHVHKPDRGLWSTQYNGLTSTSTNPDGQTTVTVSNVLGEVVTVIDHNQSAVTYAYTSLGQMRQVSRNSESRNVLTNIYFDHLGRKVKIIDPDAGVTLYRYDGFGNLLWQQDAKSQRKCNTYDNLNRLHESYNSTSASCDKQLITRDAHIEYSYDTSMYGLGMVSYIYDHVNKVGRQYDYNSLSLIYRETLTVDGKNYHQDTVYDAANQFRIKRRYDASSGNAGVEYHYSNDNYLVAKTDLISGIRVWELSATDAYGNATQFTYGNGINTVQLFDEYDGTLESIVAGQNANIQNNEYHFTNVGNLEFRRDRRTGFDENFEYDKLNRLKNWTKSGSGASGSVSVTYDNLGNIRTKTGVGRYRYERSPHAVSQITNGALSGSYVYDNNGNMVSGGGRSLISYNVNNKPTAIRTSNNVTEFVYSIEGARIKRRDTKSSLTTDTLYIGNVEFVSENGELARIQRNIEGIAIETYVHASRQRTLEYLHFDHLGSAEAITDEAGNIVQRFSFDPWGQRRNVSNYNPSFGVNSASELALEHYNKGFTGHEHLDESGLIHMNGRVYDPRLGRFLSVDPVVQQEYNLQNFNRYSYVLNNPLNATDPSGYFWDMLFKAVVNYFSSESFVQSLAMSAISYVETGSIQFTYSGANAFSYGQGAQRSLESQLFDSYDLSTSRSDSLSHAKAQANLSPNRVSQGVIGESNREERTANDGEREEESAQKEGGGFFRGVGSFFKGLYRYARHERRILGGAGIGESVQANTVEQMLLGEGLGIALHANQTQTKAGGNQLLANGETIAGRQLTSLLSGAALGGGGAGPSLGIVAGMGDVYFGIESLALELNLDVSTVDHTRPILPQISDTALRSYAEQRLGNIVNTFVSGQN